MSIDVEGFKQGQKAMWAMGDYPDLARWIEAVGELVAERVGAAPGEELLDVATGSGNVAVPAAARGARVTGLDITPELLEVARARAAQAGLEITWIEGDAEQLPFPDGSFDRVSSCFGVIFAPRQDHAARELVRVARPGATIALTAWTPEGLNGQMFKTMGAHMPPPPEGLRSPILWGSEDHVRELFSGSGVELTFERHMIDFKHDSPESWVQYNERVLGPTIMAKNALEPQGKWEPLREELLGLYRANNQAQDGSLHVSAEYLLTVARKAD
ncbi:MAG TPA: methyltransferase domain-containing protein [Solirubrobacteraceae bacterium]|jgi:SAM-dependent methyltransferase